MSFNSGSQLDTSQVSDRRGGASGSRTGTGLKVGGGIGGLLVLILGALFGGPQALSSMGFGSETATVQEAPGSGTSTCKTGADANARVDCRIVGTVNSLNVFWKAYLPNYGVAYRPAGAALESDQWNTACGPGSSDMGPFYCPADETAYFDTGFFQILKDNYGASGGPLAEEYVVAHEWGHHIQTLTGSISQGSRDPQGPQSGAVRVELQADCYAGLWAAHAASTKDPSTGQPFLEPLTRQDINDALSAAASVGDDRIQAAASGRVSPESWTHGSSQQRQQWFITGYTTGDLARCDTFAVARV